MKIALKLFLVLTTLIFIGCSAEQVNNNSVDSLEDKTNEIINDSSSFETKTTKSGKGDTQNNYNERSFSSEAASGNFIYYRVSFYSTTSAFNENMIHQNFRNATTFATSLYITSEPNTFVWIFFEEDQSIVDLIIANNGLHIEESAEPTVFKVTYDSALTNLDKGAIKGEFNILLILQSGIDQETWVYKYCCINGDPCDKFVDPTYEYYGSVSEQIIQW